jgi:hypothetical protein
MAMSTVTLNKQVQCLSKSFHRVDSCDEISELRFAIVQDALEEEVIV